jgi:hypothetical protein
MKAFIFFCVSCALSLARSVESEILNHNGELTFGREARAGCMLFYHDGRENREGLKE